MSLLEIPRIQIPFDKVITDHIYRIIYVRYVELCIVEKYDRDKAMRCPVHLSIGQEAISSSVIGNLRSADVVTGSHRGHAHYLNCGGSLFKFFCELMGKSLGVCGGRAGSQHLHDRQNNFFGSIPMIGSSVSIATGVAYALQQKGKNISVCFIGNSTIENGQFFESLNWASLKRLPLLIAFEDNNYSTYTHKSETSVLTDTLKDLSKSFKINYASLCGDNIFELQKHLPKIINQVRQEGPFLVKFDTVRRFGHVGINLEDDLQYRKINEIESFHSRDPIMFLYKKFLKKNKIDLFQKIVNDIKTYILMQYELALKSPW